MENINIYFSCIGYQEKIIPIQKLFKNKNIIELNQKTYKLQEVVINSSKTKLKSKKLGGYRKSLYNTGESNTNEYGIGKEYGIKIKFPGFEYKVNSINFNLKYNSIDSILFRINIYKISTNELPDKSILNSQIFVKSYKDNNLIVKNVSDRELYINQDIIVTIEPVHLWYAKKNDIQLFFNQCKGYNGESYLRNSSLSPWRKNVLPPFMIYLETEFYK